MEQEIGIVLLPDALTDAFVRGLSHAITRSSMRLGGRSGDGINHAPHPHVSLFQLIMNTEKLGELEGRLSHLAMQGDRTQTASEINVTSSGWHFLETPLTAKLLALQYHVICACIGLRVRTRIYSWAASFTHAQARSFELHGYPNVGEAWSPHFTFAKTDAATVWHDACPWSWTPQRLAIARLGHHQSVTELLATITL